MKSTRKAVHPVMSNPVNFTESPMKQSVLDIMVFIDAKGWAKMRHWVKLSGNDEVSCLGLVDEVKDDDRIVTLLISEIYLLEQTVSGGDTELDDKAVANLMIQLAAEGIDTSKLKCWIHSHATMRVFWSSTDEECCSLLANESYSVSIVSNKRGDLLTRIDIYNPFRVTLNNVPTQIHCTCSKELEELYSAEFVAKVKRWTKISKFPKQFQPTAKFQSEEELEEAFEQGSINMYEYEELSGQPLFDDF